MFNMEQSSEGSMNAKTDFTTNKIAMENVETHETSYRDAGSSNSIIGECKSGDDRSLGKMQAIYIKEENLEDFDSTNYETIDGKIVFTMNKIEPKDNDYGVGSTITNAEEYNSSRDCLLVKKQEIDIKEEYLELHEELDIKENISEESEVDMNIDELKEKPECEKPFKCTLCDYKCSRKYNLELHARTHTGEKPFECPLCDHRFARKYDLDRHARTHTGEKPFECSLCNYKCSQKYHLDKHAKIHIAEKSFKCSLCNYKCSQKCHLKRHARTHTGEKPFKCSLCNYKCSQKFRLKEHLRTHAVLCSCVSAAAVNVEEI